MDLRRIVERSSSSSNAVMAIVETRATTRSVDFRPPHAPQQNTHLRNKMSSVDYDEQQQQQQEEKQVQRETVQSTTRAAQLAGSPTLRPIEMMIALIDAVCLVRPSDYRTRSPPEVKRQRRSDAETTHAHAICGH